MAEIPPRVIAEIRQRLAKRRKPPVATCGMCGHQQPGQPLMATAVAGPVNFSRWRCEKCGGDVQLVYTLDWSVPTADDDIETLLAAFDGGPK